MKFKKVLAVVVTASLALSIAGCSANTKKFTDALEDMDFEKIDYSDFKDSDPDDGDFEDGVYVVASDEKEVKKLVKNMQFDIDADDVSSIVFAQRSESDDSADGNFGTYMLSFSSASAAEDVFDELIDEIEEGMGEFEMFEDYGDIGYDDDDDNMYIAAADFDIYGNEMIIRMGCYLDGKNIVCVIAVANMDYCDDYIDFVDDFCDAMELTSPSDAL